MSDLPSLEYLAGSLDVSGVLGIYARKTRVGPRVEVHIQNVNPEVPNAFAARFGGTVTLLNLKEYARGGTHRYTWILRGAPAQEMLRRLRPHMRNRLKDVERLLSVELQSAKAPRKRRLQKAAFLGAELQRVSA